MCFKIYFLKPEHRLVNRFMVRSKIHQGHISCLATYNFFFFLYVCLSIPFFRVTPEVLSFSNPENACFCPNVEKCVKVVRKCLFPVFLF